jgi:hypothetical protein
VNWLTLKPDDPGTARGRRVCSPNRFNRRHIQDASTLTSGELRTHGA